MPEIKNMKLYAKTRDHAPLVKLNSSGYWLDPDTWYEVINEGYSYYPSGKRQTATLQIPNGRAHTVKAYMCEFAYVFEK